MGYAVSAAAEFEFFMFEETPQSVRDKGYRQLKTMTPGAFGYSVLRSSVHSELYHELLELGQTMRFPIEGLHTETGPGVLEAALTYCEALEAADRAALFKTFAKVLAQRHGLMATFMAKWSNSVPGQSGHLHISLRGTGRRERIPRSSEAARDVGRHALVHRRPAGADAGVARDGRLHGEQLFAPRAGLLGADLGDLGHREPHDRAARDPRRCLEPARRVPDRGRGHQSLHRARRGDRLRALGHRASHRARCADRGQRLRPRASAAAAPARDLYEAAERLAASKPARALFGDAFVEHHAATRQWEEREFRKAITDWELARYFEII
jgi:glutamine synthetase